MSFLVEQDDSLLLNIDVQERLVPAIHGHERMCARIRLLVDAAKRLDVPVLYTEHYSKGIGHTLPELRVAGMTAIEKIHFNAMAEADGLAACLDTAGRRKILVCGCEAHVCVLQTVMGMIEADFEVCVIQDAVGSRHGEDRSCALIRMQAAGATVLTAEMVVFEWLERGDNAAFPDLLPAIRALD
ncbi:MAG: isochorismatase family protein [Geminicoccaceae bacterium]|nr:isochorismatase family protein [Geminicoccaceae bacterium]